ncbi:MAG: NinG protein [Bacteriophage sp.]|nr:MAG: NinG protein [Bacteriophage sp.]UVM87429.1 MAG: NinG protein [Bacteriophage sp.]UVX77956.1 MAG: NinG protein [Bacteriophage sp.]UWI41107.1 MAG: NinG protein [Bacteriophage sp.]
MKMHGATQKIIQMVDEMKLTKKQREELRMKFGGRCAYCGCELPEKGWHADHVEPVLRKSEQCMKAAAKGIFKLKATGELYRPEAERLENLYPACAPCNLMKTSYSLEMFRKQVSLQVARGRKSSMNFRTAERFGLIAVVERPVVFWFEKYQEENEKK